jgi:hypothetical protein
MKKIIFVAIAILYATVLFAQANSVLNYGGVSTGFGLGSIIAVVASWSRNKSILWAIIHAVLGWLYVIYYVLTR